MTETRPHAPGGACTAAPAARGQYMRLHILCPNCEQPAKASHKRQLTRLVTELSYVCQNPACGGSFAFMGEAHRWLRLPASLDPALKLPLSPSIQRRAMLEALRTLPDASMRTRGEATGAPLHAEPALPSELLHDCGHWSHLFRGGRHGA